MDFASSDSFFRSFETYEYNFQIAASRIQASEVPDATFTLVQFLFDALDNARVTSSANECSPIETVTNLLFKFAWHFRLIPVDIVTCNLFPVRIAEPEFSANVDAV